MQHLEIRKCVSGEERPPCVWNTLLYDEACNRVSLDTTPENKKSTVCCKRSVYCTCHVSSIVIINLVACRSNWNDAIRRQIDWAFICGAAEARNSTYLLDSKIRTTARWDLCRDPPESSRCCNMVNPGRTGEKRIVTWERRAQLVRFGKTNRDPVRSISEAPGVSIGRREYAGLEVGCLLPSFCAWSLGIWTPGVRSGGPADISLHEGTRGLIALRTL